MIERSEIPHTSKYFFLSPLYVGKGVRNVGKLMSKTHVFHRSTTKNLFRSTYERGFLVRTTWQCHLDGFHTQSCSLATDLEGGANCATFLAVGHLQLTLVLPAHVAENNNNERLILFISLAICCIVSCALVSLFNAEFECSISVPKAFQILSIDALPSTKITPQLNDHHRLKNLCAPSMTTFTVFIRP